MLGIQGTQNISPKLAIPRSSCIHPSTHNQVTFGNRVPQPSKSIRYTSYGNTPELSPQYWVASRLSHQQLHKEIFNVGELRYSRTATIKFWRQHLGAQLPGTLPQPLNVRRHQEQCSRHKTIGAIPRYPRDPKFFLVKFEKRRVKTLRQEASPERRRGWGVKIILLSDIYNPKTQNIFF